MVKGLKNRDGWSYLWSKQMKESLAPIPNLSNFEKLENSEGIKNFNELGIAQIPYEKKFAGGEQVGKLQLEKFLNESGQTYAKDISSPLKAPTIVQDSVHTLLTETFP